MLLTEEGIRPSFLPAALSAVVTALEITHHACNVRTYVRTTGGGGPGGIHFFSLDCTSVLATLGASLLFGLPYRLARIRRTSSDGREQFECEGPRWQAPVGRTLTCEWAVGPPLAAGAGTFQHWAAERYDLCLRWRCPGGIFRGSIEHGPWRLRGASIQLLEGGPALARCAGAPVPEGAEPAHVMCCGSGEHVRGVDFWLFKQA